MSKIKITLDTIYQILEPIRNLKQGSTKREIIKILLELGFSKETIYSLTHINKTSLHRIYVRNGICPSCEKDNMRIKKWGNNTAWECNNCHNVYVRNTTAYIQKKAKKGKKESR